MLPITIISFSLAVHLGYSAIKSCISQFVCTTVNSIPNLFYISNMSTFFVCSFIFGRYVINYKSVCFPIFLCHNFIYLLGN